LLNLNILKYESVIACWPK